MPAAASPTIRQATASVGRASQRSQLGAVGRQVGREALRVELLASRIEHGLDRRRLPAPPRRRPRPPARACRSPSTGQSSARPAPARRRCPARKPVKFPGPRSPRRARCPATPARLGQHLLQQRQQPLGVAARQRLAPCRQQHAVLRRPPQRSRRRRYRRPAGATWIRRSRAPRRPRAHSTSGGSRCRSSA